MPAKLQTPQATWTSCSEEREISRMLLRARLVTDASAAARYARSAQTYVLTERMSLSMFRASLSLRSCMLTACATSAETARYSARTADVLTRISSLFWSEEDFKDSENNGFLFTGDTKVCVRLFGNAAEHDIADPACALPEGVLAFIKAVKENYGYLIG